MFGSLKGRRLKANRWNLRGLIHSNGSSIKLPDQITLAPQIFVYLLGNPEFSCRL